MKNIPLTTWSGQWTANGTPVNTTRLLWATWAIGLWHQIWIKATKGGRLSVDGALKRRRHPIVSRALESRVTFCRKCTPSQHRLPRSSKFIKGVWFQSRAENERKNCSGKGWPPVAVWNGNVFQNANTRLTSVQNCCLVWRLNFRVVVSWKHRVLKLDTHHSPQ